NIHLAQLGDNLFSRMLLPSHDDILHMAQSHTSGRTTFQGAGQRSLASVIDLLTVPLVLTCFIRALDFMVCRTAQLVQSSQHQRL
ncbi:MAG: hypothetical protein WAP03_20565, partial [Methylorubrum rhodinum]|uniref:hypothetical protein n=1 Tax=Methylorubrum rhodinum TaxID=29428 RepID=UPI003BAE2F8F